jgi:hypothetical protein
MPKINRVQKLKSKGFWFARFGMVPLKRSKESGGVSF